MPNEEVQKLDKRIQKLSKLIKLREEGVQNLKAEKKRLVEEYNVKLREYF